MRRPRTSFIACTFLGLATACGGDDDVAPPKSTADQWQLESVSGSASLNWLDEMASGTSDLQFTVLPDIVSEGDTVGVQAKFKGAMTPKAGNSLSFNMDGSIVDYGSGSNQFVATGHHALSPHPTSGEITITTLWFVGRNLDKLELNAAGQVTGHSNSAVRRVAKYRKVPRE